MRATALFPLLLSLLGMATACGEVVLINDAGSTDRDIDASTEPTLCNGASDCSDGLRCNGDERCDPGAPGANTLGCLKGAPLCSDDEVCFEEGAEACADRCELTPDFDEDGFDAVACGGTDCNDDDKLANPDGTEVCDLDHIDEDCNPTTVGRTDGDSDGFIASTCCNPLSQSELRCGNDCDDKRPNFAIGDWAHCGACGNTCAPRESCNGSSCEKARRVFVSSTEHTGKLGGLAGADQVCKSLAEKANLGGTFRALLDDSNGGLQRLERATVAYVRLDGTLVAKSFSDLLAVQLNATLSLDENRQPHTGQAWTGLGIPTETDRFCDDWESDQSDQTGCTTKVNNCGGNGSIEETNGKWLRAGLAGCNKQFRLYCIEQ